jgi:hypothetical protein
MSATNEPEKFFAPPEVAVKKKAQAALTHQSTKENCGAQNAQPKPIQSRPALGKEGLHHSDSAKN